MGSVLRPALQRPRDYFFNLVVTDLAERTRTGFVQQVFEASQAKAVPPLAYR